MASNESSAENAECRDKKIVSSCMLLSSAFSQTPFVQPFFKPLLARNTVPVASPNIIRDLQNSVISTTDKVSKFLNSLASHNPLIQKFLSLSTEFHSFCHQVRCRNNVKMNPLGNHNFAAVLPGDSVGGLVVANGIMSFLNIYNTLLIVRLVLTWFPNSPPAIVSPLSTLCDPYLNIFRGIIPPLGGTLDLSPILAFLVLNAITSVAAALPCELPVTGLAGQQAASPAPIPVSTNLTTPQKKWIRRLCNNRGKVL
ncbi:hypothetical protein AB3S75_020575 [Citrus x aurantiifolia]